MRALALWQPWASLIFTGHKKHETRPWPTKVRGRLVISATLYMPVEEVSPALVELCEELWGNHWALDLPRGAALGVVTLADCIGAESSEAAPDAVDRLCGNWTPGRFAFRLDEAKAFPRPIPCRGGQRFWTFPDSKLPAPWSPASDPTGEAA